MLRRALPLRGFAVRPQAPVRRRPLPPFQRRANATATGPPPAADTAPKSVSVSPEAIEEETIRGPLSSPPPNLPSLL